MMKPDIENKYLISHSCYSGIAYPCLPLAKPTSNKRAREPTHCHCPHGSAFWGVGQAGQRGQRSRLGLSVESTYTVSCFVCLIWGSGQRSRRLLWKQSQFRTGGTYFISSNIYIAWTHTHSKAQGNWRRESGVLDKVSLCSSGIFLSNTSLPTELFFAFWKAPNVWPLAPDVLIVLKQLTIGCLSIWVKELNRQLPSPRSHLSVLAVSSHLHGTLVLCSFFAAVALVGNHE